MVSLGGPQWHMYILHPHPEPLPHTTENKLLGEKQETLLGPDFSRSLLKTKTS